MKIKQVKFNNHKVLGDLEVNFTDENGNRLESDLYLKTTQRGEI